MVAADEPKPKSSHTLADHVYGLDLAHTHDGYADHDHDFPDEAPLEENPIWIADHVSLMTVGIDIGSPRTQVNFSRLKLRPLRQDLSRPYFLVCRPNLLPLRLGPTPHRHARHIDQAELPAIIDGITNT